MLATLYAILSGGIAADDVDELPVAGVTEEAFVVEAIEIIVLTFGFELKFAFALCIFDIYVAATAATLFESLLSLKRVVRSLREFRSF